MKKFTNEENLVIELLQLYTNNTYSEDLSFKNFTYDEKKLIDVIKKCKIGGLVYQNIRDELLKDVPEHLVKIFADMKEEYINVEVKADNIIDNALLQFRKQGVRAVIFGSYMIQTQYCARGDILVNELKFFVDKKINLSAFEKDNFKIVQIVKESEFFDCNYYDCVKNNFANIFIAFLEEIEKLEGDCGLDDKITHLYLLHQFFVEMKNALPSMLPTYYQEKMLNSTFAVKSYQEFGNRPKYDFKKII